MSVGSNAQAGRAGSDWRGLWRPIKLLYRTISFVMAILVLRKYLTDHCGCRRLRPPRRARRRPRVDCQTISSRIYQRPDPLIYDQYYLTALGLPVTWDNPDIRLEKDGMPVDPHALEAATEYEIVARVWNGSTGAPAIEMPVSFSYLSFGVGMESHSIGTALVDLGVKGSAFCPAFAHHTWLTPPSPGHYCLQVGLHWSDDANPGNNLGQTNTDVKQLNSPRATFHVPVRNGGHRRRTVHLEANGYSVPELTPCPDTPARSGDMAREERDQRLVAAIARHTASRMLPEGWHVLLEPQSFSLEPGETIEVAVTATAPEGFEGRIGINVDARHGALLLGGVTLYAEQLTPENAFRDGN